MWPIEFYRAGELRHGEMVIVNNRYYNNEDIEVLSNEFRDNLSFVLRKVIGYSIDDKLSTMPITDRVVVLLNLKSSSLSFEDMQISSLDIDSFISRIVDNALSDR